MRSTTRIAVSRPPHTQYTHRERWYVNREHQSQATMQGKESETKRDTERKIEKKRKAREKHNKRSRSFEIFEGSEACPWLLVAATG